MARRLSSLILCCALLLSLLTGDDAYVAGLMKALNEEGHYKVTDELLLKLQAEFSCGCCDDEAAARTIGKVWAEEKYLCDPHTAVAWTVADQFAHTHDDGAPVVVKDLLHRNTI